MVCEMIEQFGIEDVFGWFIVISIELVSIFYVVEDYYQNYYKNNFGQGYCMVVILFKVVKLCQYYGDKFC